MSEDFMSFSMEEAFSCKGKVAMITGANHGLGEAYAVALAKAGADIFITHHSPDVSRVKVEIESLGRRVAFCQGDLTQKEHREACVEACLKEFGRIDILINNAGRNHAAPLLEFEDDEWKKVVDLQMEAVHYLSRAVAKVMAKQGGGKIINIASALSFAADPNACAYTAAKHAIIGITRSFAAELGKYHITCNAIAPGFFMSNMTGEIRAANPGLYERVGNRIALSDDGNWGDIKDLMGAVVFFSCPASDYITGDVMVVDGGFKAVMV